MIRIVALALLFSASTPLLARTADPVHDLKQLEEQWAGAITRHDAAAVDKILAPDFRHIAYNGAVTTRAEALAAAADSRRVMIQHVHDVDVRVYGQRFAVVSGLNDAQSSAGSAQLRFTDVFVFQQGRWQAVSAQETVVQH
jgi:ketosteroid isomerase-like protein